MEKKQGYMVSQAVLKAEIKCLTPQGCGIFNSFIQLSVVIHCDVNYQVVQCPEVNRHLSPSQVMSLSELWKFLGRGQQRVHTSKWSWIQICPSGPGLFLIGLGFLRLSHFRIFRNIQETFENQRMFLAYSPGSVCNFHFLLCQNFLFLHFHYIRISRNSDG